MRRHATLVEVLVALCLTTLLLTSVFSIWRYTARASQQADLLLSTVREEAALRLRLDQILTQTLRGTFYSEEAYQNPSLVFTFDNGPQLERHFSGPVLARLFVDSNQRLALTLWPHPDHWKLDPPPSATEILASDVTRLNLAFYEPPSWGPEIDSPTIEVGREKHSPDPDRWHSEWREKFQELPALVRFTLTIDGDEEQHTITTSLPEAQKPLRYHHIVRQSL